MKDYTAQFEVETGWIMRILLIEDNPDIIKLFEAGLKDGKYSIIGEADCGTKGIKQFLTLKPDIVILDILLKVSCGECEECLVHSGVTTLVEIMKIDMKLLHQLEKPGVTLQKILLK